MASSAALDEQSPSDPSRRRLLEATTATLATLGTLIAAIPFVESLEPSERARALGAPVAMPVGGLKPGELLIARWRRKPICVLRRTHQQLEGLSTLRRGLKDPYSRMPQQPVDLPHWNPVLRSIRPEYLVVVGICTHLGCMPKYRPTPGDPELGANWPGGFYCPCHGSRYDLAGRVMDGSPAPLNLPVPPYFYRSDSIVMTGELKDGAEQDWQPAIW